MGEVMMLDPPWHLIHSVFIRICVCSRGKLGAPSPQLLLEDIDVFQRWSPGAQTSGMFWISSQKREDQAAFGPGAETIQAFFFPLFAPHL